jgi:hypothetical protein
MSSSKNEKDSTTTATGNLFLPVPDTDFRDFLLEIDQFAQSEPEIIAAIQGDLDAHAKREKLMRKMDKEFIAAQTKDLPGVAVETKVVSEKDLTLQSGRPRMSAYLVFIFIMIRGFMGSLTTKQSKRFIEESMSLFGFLQDKGYKRPAFNTILDNANVVSLPTYALLFDRQIRFVLNSKLDDFKQLTIDSTAVHANTRWPTDGSVLHGLLQRAHFIGQKLDRFGITKFKSGYVPRWLNEIDQLEFEINMAAGKPGSKRKMKKCYANLLKKGRQARAALEKEFISIEQSMDINRFIPSKRAQVEAVMAQLRSDLSDAGKVIDYTEKRVMHGINLPSKEKILSLSDGSAAYIAKGQRDPIIGYKPQLVRSANGFVTSMIVPEGNAADSAQFVPAISESIKRTDVIAELVSADDGYASAAGKNALLELKIGDVSISGSKGKKLTSPEDWDSETHRNARRNRSAVESLMFTIKDGFNFGEVGRRGIDAVRSELTEKVLAYNFCRIIEIRSRQQAELKKAS